MFICRYQPLVHPVSHVPGVRLCWAAVHARLKVEGGSQFSSPCQNSDWSDPCIKNNLWLSAACACHLWGLFWKKDLECASRAGAKAHCQCLPWEPSEVWWMLGRAFNIQEHKHGHGSNITAPREHGFINLTSGVLTATLLAPFLKVGTASIAVLWEKAHLTEALYIVLFTKSY